MEFDDFYSRTDYYYSHHSDGLENAIIKYNIEPCSALDIGAGEGRNSVFLAKQGFDVVAVEPSKRGVLSIRKRAQEARVSIEIVNDDLLTAVNTISRAGFVIALTCLEHMDDNYLPKAIDVIKDKLLPNGYLYIVSFTEDDPGCTNDMAYASECSSLVKHYFKHGELKSLFEGGFEILEYTEYMKKDTSHGPVHYHGKAKIIARKLVI